MSAVKFFKKTIFHISFIAVSAVLMLHRAPFFSDFNQRIIDSLKLADDSQPFTMFLNFDKALVGFLVLFFFGFSLRKKAEWKQSLQTSLFCFTACCVVIFSVALYLNVVRWNPKLPQESFVFLLNNLLIVCFAEEAFFRRYVQGHLQELFLFRGGQLVALFIAAVVFGFAHFQGGPLMIAFSSMAGLFYGLTYLRTGRLGFAVLTHFGFNAVHFLFFSYPFLALQSSQ